jgi:hypothetical protein
VARVARINGTAERPGELVGREQLPVLGIVAMKCQIDRRHRVGPIKSGTQVPIVFHMR